MKKIVRTVFFSLAAAFILFFCYTLLPRNVDNMFEGAIIRLDGGYYEQATVRMRGRLYSPLFFKPRFEGTLHIEQYGFLNERQLQDITLSFLSRGIYEGEISYGIFMNGNFETVRPFAKLRASKDFSQLCIMIYEPLDSDSARFRNTSGLVLIAPASSEKSAGEIAARMTGIEMP